MYELLYFCPYKGINSQKLLLYIKLFRTNKWILFVIYDRLYTKKIIQY